MNLCCCLKFDLYEILFGNFDLNRPINGIENHNNNNLAKTQLSIVIAPVFVCLCRVMEFLLVNYIIIMTTVRLKHIEEMGCKMFLLLNQFYISLPENKYNGTEMFRRQLQFPSLENTPANRLTGSLMCCVDKEQKIIIKLAREFISLTELIPSLQLVDSLSKKYIIFEMFISPGPLLLDLLSVKYDNIIQYFPF